jgi:hypothetical protein
LGYHPIIRRFQEMTDYPPQPRMPSWLESNLFRFDSNELGIVLWAWAKVESDDPSQQRAELVETIEGMTEPSPAGPYASAIDKLKNIQIP